jgi:hypothetical protein
MSLQGIKNHFREFLYDFALKRNKLLVKISAEEKNNEEKK